MARPTEILSWRGVRTDRARHLLEPGELAAARNVLCDDGGYLTIRRGYDVTMRLDSLRNLVLPVLLFNAAGCTWSDAETGDAGNAAVGQRPLAGCTAGQGPELVTSGVKVLNAAIQIRQQVAGVPEEEWIELDRSHSLAEYKTIVNALGAYYIVPGFAGAEAGPQIVGEHVADEISTTGQLWALLQESFRITEGAGEDQFTGVADPYGEAFGVTEMEAMANAWAANPDLATTPCELAVCIISTSFIPPPYDFRCQIFMVSVNTYVGGGWRTDIPHSGVCWAQTTWDPPEYYHNLGWSPEIPDTVGKWALVAEREVGYWGEWSPELIRPSAPVAFHPMSHVYTCGWSIYDTPRVILLTWDFAAYDTGP